MTKIGADERRSARSKVMLTGTVESEGGRIQVKVDELSAHGARVLGDEIFPMDTPVTFRCNDLTVEGFVAWVQAPLAGIGFGEPVQPQEALRTVPRPRIKIAVDFRRPGFRARQLTDAEMKLANEWATPQ